MKQRRVWTMFFCTNLIIMSILLQGCAGTTHIPVTQSGPTVTTETHTIVEQRVKNPETGVYEMKVVREERRRTVEERRRTVEERRRTVSTVTGDNVFDPPQTPNAHTKEDESIISHSEFPWGTLITVGGAVVTFGLALWLGGD